jgi:hypothetical protein
MQLACMACVWRVYGVCMASQRPAAQHVQRNLLSATPWGLEGGGGGGATLREGPVAPQPVRTRPAAAPLPIAPPQAHCVGTHTHQCWHTHTTHVSRPTTPSFSAACYEAR